MRFALAALVNLLCGFAVIGFGVLLLGAWFR